MDILRKSTLFSALLLAVSFSAKADNCNDAQTIEVTGTATVNIVPDRITIEIGMEEYYKYKVFATAPLSNYLKLKRKCVKP